MTVCIGLNRLQLLRLDVAKFEYGVLVAVKRYKSCSGARYEAYFDICIGKAACEVVKLQCKEISVSRQRSRR